VCIVLLLSIGAAAGAPQRLCNGIVLPDAWPVRSAALTCAPLAVPYLADPPAVVLIDVACNALASKLTGRWESLEDGDRRKV
jgi:hypothetical protein